jgi:hypothetical protein
MDNRENEIVIALKDFRINIKRRVFAGLKRAVGGAYLKKHAKSRSFQKFNKLIIATLRPKNFLRY